MFEAAFEPPSETPCDPVPAAESVWAGRRTRIAATLGVGLVGAASLSTAVYQTISQSSTTVVMPGAVQELDTPLPWGTPVAAPAGTVASSPTITPTVADLALRSEQQPLAEPVAPALGASAPRPAAGPVDAGPRPSPEARGGGGVGGGGGGRPSTTSGGSGAPSTTTGTGTTSPGSSSPPSSTGPSSTGPSSTGPSGEPTGEPTSEPSTQPSTQPPSSDPPASGEPPSDATTSPSGDGAG